MIWLIGCNGMLGNEIARQLEEKNIDFVGSDREVDFTDEAACRNFMAGRKIDYIINCAAYTAVDKAETEPELAAKLNAEGPKNIAKLAKEIGATLIHISTDYVFDGTGNTPRTEDMAVSPLGVYGATKADGEKAVAENSDKYYILRTAWLYGWAGKNFVYTMIRAMNLRDSVTVVNDQFGTPTFAGTLASVVLRVMEKKALPYGIYHCTDSGEISWWDFTNEIKRQGLKVGLVTKDVPVNPCTTAEYNEMVKTSAKRPAYSVLSKDKIQNALGITLPDWKKSLKEFLTNPLFDKSRIE